MRIDKVICTCFLLGLCSYANASDTAVSLDLDSNGFVLLSAMLVLLMSIPGIGLFYGGLVRSKNILSTLEQCLAVFSLAIFLWFIVGYSFAFGQNSGFLGDFFGGFDKLLLLDVKTDSLLRNFILFNRRCNS